MLPLLPLLPYHSLEDCEHFIFLCVFYIVKMAFVDAVKENPAVVSLAEQPKSDIYSHHGEKDLDENFGVPERYKGTTTDKREMSMLGNKQVLRVCVLNSMPLPLPRQCMGWTNGVSTNTVQRNFHFITMVGFASTVMASWEILLP